ncbi:MAG: hypothetical protein JWM99_4968 [Verrucomicrobiales bacterium]|nr:hypothetical protein [Verrucomicrobiales bacterium]
MNNYNAAILLLFALINSVIGAVPYRTDINPALRYYQAFMESLQVPEGDRQYLMTNEWRGQKLESRFGDILKKYDYEFRIVDEASHSQAPCDWGIDLTQGPDALLPGLAPAKSVAQVTRLRTMWNLQNDRQDQARNEMISAFVLARNLSRDGVLISALVQIAMENILASVVAENFYQWGPEILKEILAGFDAAPPRGTIAQCIPGEKLAFQGWLLGSVADIQSANVGKESASMTQIRALFARVGGEDQPDFEFADKVIKAAGGSSDGVLNLIQGLGPVYERVTALMNLPPAAYEAPMKQFINELPAHPNPLVWAFFRVFENCRNKEFGIQVKMEMVRAGIEYKLHGESGLKSVQDPFGNGPFGFQRFVLNGEDRGFQLKSGFHGRGFDEVLIFVEKNGPPFMIDGKNAGRAASKD